MDIVANTHLKRASDVLKSLGFKVHFRERVLDASRSEGQGRIHVLGVSLGKDSIYLDIHWDARIHFLWFGVDYAKKVRLVCDNLLDALTKQGIAAQVDGGDSWFNRKNKAILHGIRL